MMILPLLALILSSAPAATRAPLPVASIRAQDMSVDELLASGRKLLLEGNYTLARQVFEEAEKKETSLRTRVFVLRAMIGEGNLDDALLEVDKLKEKNGAAIEFDYLHGTGFYALAARDVASGQTTSVTGSQFEDAVALLSRVTEKNDPRFDDAWTTLAEATWYTQAFELGAKASKRAAEISPADPERSMLRGKLALAAYAAWRGDETMTDAAEEQWQAAVEAYEKAISICGEEPDAKMLPVAQRAWTQLATTFLWKQMIPDASSALVRAVVLDPKTADYAAVSNSLAGQDLLDALQLANKKWLAKHPGATTDATLMWWLGYANYAVKDLPEAEKAFEASLAKVPEYWSSLYYLYRIRFEKMEFAKCLETLHRYPAVDPSSPGCTMPASVAGIADAGPDRGGLIAALSYDVPGNTARLEALVGWAMDDKNHKGKTLNLEAAFACDLITRIVPREPDYSRHWNNLGLFLRDEGDQLRGTQGALEKAPRPYDEAKVTRLWECSMAAYETALEIEPNNPNYLNDLAVMLHYYFVRDLERAKEMYQRGNVEAKKMLERKDLSPETRAAVQIALRDTGNNVRLVQKLIDKRAAEAAAPKPPEKPANQ